MIDGDAVLFFGLVHVYTDNESRFDGSTAQHKCLEEKKDEDKATGCLKDNGYDYRMMLTILVTICYRLVFKKFN